MVSELVIHLGDHKTGSTALQKSLAAGALRIDGQLPFHVHHGLAKPLMRRRPDPEIYRPRYAAIGARLDTSGAAIGILSSEGFEYVTPEHLATVISECLPQYRDRVRLIAYVRPHVDRFTATFAERTKIGTSTDLMEPFFDRVIQMGMLEYAPRFTRWKAVFGDCFTLRPYLRDQLTDGDVVADFAVWLAQGKPWFVANEINSNEALNLADLSLMRLLQQQAKAMTPPLPPAIRAPLGRNLAGIMADRRHPQPIRLGIHRALAQRIATHFAADAAALDAVFFQDAPMTRAIRAAPDRAIETAQSLAPADCLSPAERRISQIGVDLLLRIAAADPEHFSWAIRST